MCGAVGLAASFFRDYALCRSGSLLGIWLKTGERQENGKLRATGTNGFHCSPMGLRYTFHQSET
jgi:hypothetical protein